MYQNSSSAAVVIGVLRVKSRATANGLKFCTLFSFSSQINVHNRVGFHKIANREDTDQTASEAV